MFFSQLLLVYLLNLSWASILYVCFWTRCWDRLSGSGIPQKFSYTQQGKFNEYYITQDAYKKIINFLKIRYLWPNIRTTSLIKLKAAPTHKHTYLYPTPGRSNHTLNFEFVLRSLFKNNLTSHACF